MNHLYEDKNGILHDAICEQIIPNDRGTFICWTACGKMDIPANKSFKSKEIANCEDCREAKK